MIKRMVKIVVAILVLAGMYFWMNRAYIDKIAPGVVSAAQVRISPDIHTGDIELRKMELTGEAVGTVRSKHRTVIASKILSRVEKVYVRAGDKVKEGQVLVELDQSELAAGKSAAMAAVQAAQADLEWRNREFERVKTLRQKEVMSQQEYDLAMSNRDAAMARVRQAREQVAVVSSTLEYTRIAAPVSGIIIERAAEPGDMAVQGKELLTMYDPKSLRLEALVPESLLPFVSVGRSLPFVVDTVGLEGTGQVEEVVPQAAAATRTFTVKVIIPNPEKLYPGMFGRLKIPYGTTKRLLIPVDALRHVGQVELVEVVNPDGTITRRQVTGGELFGDKVEILSGLQPPEEPNAPRKVVIR